MRIISEHKNAGRFAPINWRHKVRRHTEHAYVLDVLHKEKTAHMCDLHNFLLSQYTYAYEVKGALLLRCMFLSRLSQYAYAYEVKEIDAEFVAVAGSSQYTYAYEVKENTKQAENDMFLSQYTYAYKVKGCSRQQ